MNRALVVIDVQNEYIDGALPISHPDPSVSLANIGAAMDAAAEAGIPIVVIRHISPAGSPLFADGGPGAQLHSVVTDRAYDVVFDKTLPSSFTGTGLADWLAERGIDTLVIAGYMTQNCDESTAREAAHRGYAVEFLSDATGTLAMANEVGALTAEQLHTAVLVVLQSRFAAVATTAEWIDAVRTGGQLPRSNIVASMAVARSGD